LFYVAQQNLKESLNNEINIKKRRKS